MAPSSTTPGALMRLGLDPSTNFVRNNNSSRRLAPAFSRSEQSLSASHDNAETKNTIADISEEALCETSLPNSACPQANIIQPNPNSRKGLDFPPALVHCKQETTSKSSLTKLGRRLFGSARTASHQRDDLRQTKPQPGKSIQMSTLFSAGVYARIVHIIQSLSARNICRYMHTQK